MKRKLMLVLLTVVAALCCAFAFAACTVSSSGANGTYYLYENGQTDKSQYIKLDGDKWSDDDNASGTYKKSGSTVTFYAEVFGSNEEMFSGTLDGNKLEISVFGDKKVYYKDGTAPSGGDDKPTTHDHVWDTEWTIGETTHYHACTVAGCTAKNDEAAHDFTSGDCVCGKHDDSQPIVKEFEVTFYLNYNDAAPVTRETVDKLVTYIPTRDGYDFSGWYTDTELMHLFDTEEPVNESGLILYAAWSEKPTEEGQLPAPVLNVKDGEFSWRAVPGANGYRIIVRSSEYSEDLVNETTDNTSWDFPYSFEAGYYVVKIRALGDGITTTNSVYSTRNFNLRVLDTVTGINLDRATSVLSWNSVENAYEYDLTFKNVPLTVTVTQNSYDMSDLDAGDYIVSIAAKRNNWKTSFSASQTVNKMRLKAPEIEVASDIEANAYVLSWKPVSNADTYILKYGDKEIKINDTSYTIGTDSVIWGDGNTASFTIDSFDSNSDYLISSSKTPVTLNKLYRIKIKNSLTEAGEINITNNFGLLSVSGNEYTLTAETNDGYTWVGWYDGETELTKELNYTFTMSAEDINYTAKWIICPVTIEKSISEGGSIHLPLKTIVGQQTTVEAISNLGYTWIGWFRDETELTKELSYTFAMPTEDVTYTAKWEINGNLDKFIFESTTTECEIKGLKDTTLTSITIPDSVTSISGNAFKNCSGLTSITIPDSVTYIGWDVFEDTAWYNNQPDGLVYAGKVAYKYKGTMPDNTSITLEDGTKGIAGRTFYNCSKLTSITIPDSVTCIGQQAFSACSKLASVTIGNSVTSIGWNAFENCSKLTSVNIPDSVTSIDSRVFSGCSGLTSITIPDSVTSIGSHAFSGCSKLTSITIPDSITSIGYEAFENCINLTSITIPDSVVSIGMWAFYGCSGLKSLYYTGDIAGWCSIDGLEYLVLSDVYVNYSLYVGFNYRAPLCKVYIGNQELRKMTNITIPDSVTSIGDSAFYYCSGLKSITIPDSVTSIGDDAFLGCSGLTNITIPDSVTSIGYGAFAYCSKLTSVIIPDSVTSIGNSAFYECGNVSFKIFCETSGKPSGWSSIWNLKFSFNNGQYKDIQYFTVVWGYKSEDNN